MQERTHTTWILNKSRGLFVRGFVVGLGPSCCFGDVVWTLEGITLVTCVRIYLGADSALGYLCPPVTVSVSFRFHSLCKAHSALNCLERNLKWSSCFSTAWRTPHAIVLQGRVQDLPPVRLDSTASFSDKDEAKTRIHPVELAQSISSTNNKQKDETISS